MVKGKGDAAVLNCAFDVSLILFSPSYLNDVYAGVQVDGSFGVLAVLLILVGVENVGAIRELGQVEVPPFEHLHFTVTERKSGR